MENPRVIEMRPAEHVPQIVERLKRAWVLEDDQVE
jgi:hypothetical protein